MTRTPAFIIIITLLSACQNFNPSDIQLSTQENPNTQTQSTTPTHPAIKNQPIAFQKQLSNYPILADKAYQAVNGDIAKLIQDLVAFDKQFDKDTIGGVDWLEYEILTPNDNELSILIKYAVTDMTTRSFQKYYQLDLQKKQQMLLNEYLTNNQINIPKINENLNKFLKECHSNGLQTQQCDDPSLYYMTFGWDNNIDILEHHTGFYVIDKDHIAIAFDSAKFTTSFKVNIKTYQISLSSQ